MILINKIRPLKSVASIDLSSITSEYLINIKNHSGPWKWLDDLDNKRNVRIKKQIYDPTIFNSAQEQYIKNLIANFDQLITGTPDVLENFGTTYSTSIIGVPKVTRFGKTFELNPFGKMILAIFGYENYYRGLLTKGLWYAEKLNIRSCPYCNSQYTLVVTSKSKKSQAKFQFDHFFSKKRYPFLSISLYNLIPACANCNLAKSDGNFKISTHYHPYYSNIAEKAKFHLSPTLDISKLTTGDVHNLPIDVSFKAIKSSDDAIVDEHNKIYNIDGIYKRLDDQVRILLKKAIVNNKRSGTSIRKIRNLFPDKKTYNDYLLDGYSLETEITNKPLTKLTLDIADQLGLL